MPETVSFEHYEVLTRDDGSLYELGRGAMGVTYKAFDTSLRVPVALKVINATYLHSEVARLRFVREAQSAAKLRHRNVATVYHLGTEGDAWFYAMEFIDGETVDALVKRHGRLEPALALQIAAQVARALNAAMPHGLVHRDIKPANLMLVREDDELVVKVIDFGLALSAADEETVPAGFVGTPHFASPEQLESRDLDVRSDIYSLGVTLWFMLAGRTPFNGTMEQVKQRHLAQAPPFADLAKLPEPVAAVLRKALEKDAAKRHQTPQEFRRALEECIDQLSGDGAQEAQDEEISSLLDDAHQRAGETQFEPHAVIAGRYRIVEATGETNTGRTFRCYDRERQCDVRMLVLRSGLEGAACTQIEREVERIAPTRHENLIQIQEFAAIDGASFLVTEWTDGFSLLELLRARRELEAGETLALLEQAARGADHALAAGLKCIDFALHAIAIHFGQALDREKLLHMPLPTWPAFTLKLNPLGVAQEITASETWAGGQTMVHRTPGGGAEIDPRARYVQALGAVAYELLGGSISPLQVSGVGFESMAHRYTPLSTLSEEGNEVLKRALNPAESFGSAQEFFETLKNLEVLGVRPAQPRPQTGSAIRPATLAETSPRTRLPATDATAAAPPKKRFPVKFFGGLATAGAIAFGIYSLAPRAEPEMAIEPGSAATFTDSPEVTPTAPDAPPLTVEPTPAPAMRVHLEREEKLRAALAAAEAAEQSGDPAEAISSWLRVARDFPESDAPRKRLDFVIDPLRKRAEIKKPEVFDALKPLFIEAAQLDSLSAVLLLADAERTLADPERPMPDEERARRLRESFAWYSTAAARGHVEAYTQLGLIFSNGIGKNGELEPDLEKAFHYFSLAVEQNDVDAKAMLAECYLRGKGVAPDVERGLREAREAADRGNLIAMNLIAGAFAAGAYTLPVNFDEAFRLWSKVVETKDPAGQYKRPVGEAHANLGVLYMNGQGTTADAVRAVKLFSDGARLGDANCSFWLGVCHHDGLGGLAKNTAEALRLIKRGAVGGSRKAQAWCRQNGVDFETR